MKFWLAWNSYLQHKYESTTNNIPASWEETTGISLKNMSNLLKYIMRNDPVCK